MHRCTFARLFFCMMKTKTTYLLFVLTIFIVKPLAAQFTIGPTPDNATVADSVKPKSRLTIGGYGEAVYKYNFYSDNMFRYSHAEKYADAKGHGRVDLPHAVFMMSYDFGRGWTVEKFRNLSKEDRNAIVQFINAI